MKAFVSIFPSGKMIASIVPSGKIIISNDDDKLVRALSMSGVTDVVKEYIWDKMIFEKPIEHTSQGGDHLFTDRGNLVTFDRVRVSDEEIRQALVHAKQKFGQEITLRGDNRMFSERMARIADDMGITILNPEMKPVIENHRTDRIRQNPNIK